MKAAVSAAVWSLAAIVVAGAGQEPSRSADARSARPAIVLENARVRVLRTTGRGVAGVDHGPGVVVSLDDRPGRPAGSAVWTDDVAVQAQGGDAGEGSLIIVQPKRAAPSPSSRPAPGSKPGDAPFVGMSFKTLFENDRVSVLRARMDVDAREGVHTHASDTLVVHLSGGDIEDTADGKTIVNRWKPGDVEFEARGSSHSARNVGRAVDVVLVALKP